MESNYDMDIYGEAPDKMTYTEQANKRAHCKRLTCFIRLADYLIVNTMHVLAVNSVSTLLNYLGEQLQKTPPLADIQGWNKPLEAATGEKKGGEEEKDSREKDKPVVDEEEADAPAVPPLFITEFVLEPNQLLFKPDEEEFQSGLAEVIKGFQDTVLQVPNLVPDAYFDAFTRCDPHQAVCLFFDGASCWGFSLSISLTLMGYLCMFLSRPIINSKFEEKTCGEGPSLPTMFEDDKHLQGLIQNIRVRKSQID